jgi:hypothetical protein
MQEWMTRIRGRTTSAGPAGTGQRSPAAFRSHVTTRGALAGMFALCLVACLLAAWWRLGALAGLAFVAGCVLAPIYARRDALLHIVIAVPVIFLLAEIVTQAMTAQGNSGHGSALSVLDGTILALAGVAPWLFAGTALCVAVAMTRGLPQCVRDLRMPSGSTAFGIPPDRSDAAATNPRRG